MWEQSARAEVAMARHGGDGEGRAVADAKVSQGSSSSEFKLQFAACPKRKLKFELGTV